MLRPYMALQLFLKYSFTPRAQYIAPLRFFKTLRFVYNKNSLFMNEY